MQSELTIAVVLVALVPGGVVLLLHHFECLNPLPVQHVTREWIGKRIN